MGAAVDAMFEAAMKLSDVERIELGDRLLSSVTLSAQAEVDQAWAAEAERRYQGSRTDRSRPSITKRRCGPSVSG